MRTEKLGDIVYEIKTGKTPPTSNLNYFGDEIPWYTPTDLDRNKDLEASIRGITNLAIIEKKAITYEPNTLLIGCIGDIGKIGITRNLSSSNQQITGVRPNDKIINVDYLYYWFKANKRVLQNTSTSAIVPILNNKQLSSIRVSFPEKVSDQIKIATILSKAETLIKQRKESIALLDEFLKSTFLEMFGDPQFNPKAFELKTLNEISSIKGQYGSGASAIDYIPQRPRYIRITDILENGELISEKKSPSTDENEDKKYLLEDGDLLFARSGATVGKTYLHKKENGEAIFAGYLIRFKINKSIALPTYVYQFTKTKYYLNWVRMNQIVATQPNVNANLYGNELNIPIPPIELQNQFALLVEKVETIKEQCKASLKELENLFGSLSQRAFKGELGLGGKIEEQRFIGDPFGDIETDKGAIAIKDEDTTPNIRAEVTPDSNKFDAYVPQPKTAVFKKKQILLKKKTIRLKPKERFTWENVSMQQIANWLKDKYTGLHFSSEMALRYLWNEHLTSVNYFSSEELKKQPQLNEADDFKALIFPALDIANTNFFLKLEQVFYDATKDNIQLRLAPEDYELIKERSSEERSGIYFSIVQ